MDQHFKTKTHLDKANGITKDKITKDLQSSFTDGSVFCDICNTRYDNKKKHIESEQHKENDKKKKLVDVKWRDKVNELRLDHNMKHNQVVITCSDYEDPRFV